MYKAVDHRTVGDDPDGIIAHLDNIVDEAGVKAVVRGVVDEARTVVDAEAAVSGDIEPAFPVLEELPGAVADEAARGCIVNKGELLGVPGLQETDQECEKKDYMDVDAAQVSICTPKVLKFFYVSQSRRS